MEKISYYTKIAKSGDRIYVNIPYDYHIDINEKIGKQIKVTIEEAN